MTPIQGKELVVAIVGYGRSGRDIHRRLLSQLGGLYSIASLVDSDGERRALAAAENDCPVLADHRELIGRKDIDLVVNASFSRDHAAISAELLRSGFAVLSEKPAAANADEFRAVLAAAEESGSTYRVFQQYRFSASFLKIKELIASGVLGRVVQARLSYSGFNRRWDWQTVQAFAGGSLLNTGPHPVDQALDLMGFPEAPEVFCAMDRAQTSGDGEDHVKLVLRARGAPTLDVDISSCNAFADSTYLVLGSRGTLRGDPKKLEWKYYVEADEPKRPLVKEPLRNERAEPIYCSEKLNFHSGEWTAEGEDEDDFNGKGLRFYRELHRSLSSLSPFPVEADQVLKQLLVIDEAHRQNEDLLDRFVPL